MKDPIRRFQNWMRLARDAGIPQANAMALATASAAGTPSLRMVLLKRVDERGFVFFTDSRSRKGRELRDNPRVAATFWWDPIGRQVRIEGSVSLIPDRETDAYWATRRRASQLSGAASRQSAALAARSELSGRRRELDQAHRDGAVPRPEAWKGYLIRARRIEFWREGEGRFHHRELFRRVGGEWRSSLLQP